MLSFASSPLSEMTRLDANSPAHSPFENRAEPLGITAMPVTISRPFGAVAADIPVGPATAGAPFDPVAASRPLAPAAGVGEWSIVPSLNLPAQSLNFLNGITCVSASDCWAAGYYNANTSGYRTLLERWNGTSWSIVPSPNNPQDNFLYGVTCTSSSDCWAVGYYNAGVISPVIGIVNQPVYQTLIQRWNGTSWTIVSSPNTNPAQSNYLRNVTCTSASDCWAVGYSHNGLALQTLIMRWNGTSWTIVSSPSAAPNLDNGFLGVTCVSANDCWAVGQSHNGTALQTLTERWNGTAWTIVASPNASTNRINGLQAVTCLSSSDCWAVGFHNTGGVTYQTLIERWNGSSWAIFVSPNTSPSQSNFLQGITCVSASDCWAVGSHVARWNGTSWTIVPSPLPSPSQVNVLTGVTCLSASDCRAAGNYQSVGGYYQILNERWDGTSWALEPSPESGANQNNFLPGVTCVSESDCWAVGHSWTGAAYRTLIEHWDGTSWSVVPSPSTSNTQSNYLTGVTCLSASDCWAVGRYLTLGSGNQTLILHWDGTSWAIVPSPNTSATQDNSLYAITCVSASDCWAVGTSASPNYQTLIERWNGISWAIVTSPNVSTGNVLQGVTCLSASNCWAVGFSNSGSNSQTLTERWDGTSWAVVPSSNTGSTYNFLYGVACASASDCWAVGYSSANGVINQSLIERWNGTSWAIVASPTPPLAYTDFLLAVTCTSASNCWAVGTYSEDTFKPLIKHWDGVSWALVSSPYTSPPVSFSLSRGDYLQAVTCLPSANCWATGYSSSDFTATLTMKHTALPVPTSALSRKTHGTAGTFDVNLPLVGTSGIECRSGGSNNDYQIVITFPSAVTFSNAAVTSGTGTVSNSSGNGTTAVTVNLTGVTNAQTITLTLFGVNDGTHTNDVALKMSVLSGDTNADGFVNSADISQTKAQSGAALTNSNFRQDVTVDGFLNSADISLVKSKSGTALP